MDMNYTNPAALWWFSLATFCQQGCENWQEGRRAVHLPSVSWGLSGSCPRKSSVEMVWAARALHKGSCAPSHCPSCLLLGHVAPLEDTAPPPRFPGCSIISLHSSAIGWVSTVSPGQSKMKDLCTISSEKCLMLPRPTYFI